MQAASSASCPRTRSFYDYLTAEELLAYFARLFDIPAAERAARVAPCSTRSGSARERRMRLRSYSKGMVQRVGIAQAILNEPEIVFFDEPMSGLDPLGRRDVRQLMLRLRDRGCTVFFSSHILSDAETLCSQVGIVAQGKLVAGGRLSELARPSRLKGWELVIDRRLGRRRWRRCGRTARHRRGARPTAATPWNCRPSPPEAIRAAPRLPPARQRACRSTRSATRSRTSSCSTWRGDRRPGHVTAMSARAVRAVAAGGVQESVRDRVPYSLVLFAILLMARVVLHEPAHRRRRT